MFDIIKVITEKWGTLTELDSFKANGMPDYMQGTAFNYIYIMSEKETVEKILRKNKIILSEELIDFYREYNGVKLFLSGFSLYGFPIKRNTYNPYDFCVENMRIHIEMVNNNCDKPEWIFFGSYAGLYVFAYDRLSVKQYVCVERGKSDILLSFDSFEELVSYFVLSIITKYDENCNKLIPNEEYRDIPVLANAMVALEELV